MGKFLLSGKAHAPMPTLRSSRNKGQQHGGVGGAGERRDRSIVLVLFFLLVSYSCVFHLVLIRSLHAASVDDAIESSSADGRTAVTPELDRRPVEAVTTGHVKDLRKMDGGPPQPIVPSPRKKIDVVGGGRVRGDKTKKREEPRTHAHGPEKKQRKHGPPGRHEKDKDGRKAKPVKKSRQHVTTRNVGDARGQQQQQHENLAKVRKMMRERQREVNREEIEQGKYVRKDIVSEKKKAMDEYVAETRQHMEDVKLGKIPKDQPMKFDERNRLGYNHAAEIAAAEEAEGKAAKVVAAKKEKPWGESTPIPLLVITCERAEYLRRSLESVWKYHPVNNNDADADAEAPLAPPQAYTAGVPIVVSQDGTNADVQAVIRQYQSKFDGVGVPFHHLVFEAPPLTPEEERAHAELLRKRKQAALDARKYKKLAMHYGYAIGRIFDSSSDLLVDKDKPFDAVVILEEDLEIAPDFFGYMSHLAPLLLNNWSKLMAVSAFNDNGREGMVGTSRGMESAKRVMRTDFFSGLGWMMPRFLWDEVGGEKGWAPNGYWDDWLREPERVQGREFLRPEISRTYHFGQKGGTSHNQFGKNLARIHLNTVPVKWGTVDVASSLEKSMYDPQYMDELRAANKASSPEDALEKIKEGNVFLEYDNFKTFQRYAKRLDIMSDEKAGVPRTSYKGVVEVRPDGGDFLLFISPPLEEVGKELSTAVV